MRPLRLSIQTATAAMQPAPFSPATARSAGYGSSAPARQRRLVIGALLALHASGVVGLLNAGRLRDAVVEARPMFLSVVDAPAAPTPPRPLPPPPVAKAPLPLPLTLPLVAPEATPSPSPLFAQAVPPSPPALAAPEAEVPAPAPASSLPRTIPPSAVQYLVPPVPVYSRVSARMRESGKALVRVYIDEDGLPRNVQLATSTGYSRLDEAALSAVRGCRFKPYFENGVAVAGWAAIPIEFELPA